MQLKLKKHIIDIATCTNVAQIDRLNFQISGVSMIFQNGPFIQLHKILFSIVVFFSSALVLPVIVGYIIARLRGEGNETKNYFIAK